MYTAFQKSHYGVKLPQYVEFFQPVKKLTTNDLYHIKNPEIPFLQVWWTAPYPPTLPVMEALLHTENIS